MKASNPSRFRDLHLLVDRGKQAEQYQEDGMHLSPAALEQARIEMEQNYQAQEWRKQHKLQAALGIRWTGLATFGMVLCLGGFYALIKYGTIEPYPPTPPRFVLTQWLKHHP
jgi:hypothetical protein